MAVVLNGPAHSTYARIARLALEERGVPYAPHAVDTLSGEGRKPNTSRAIPGARSRCSATTASPSPKRRPSPAASTSLPRPRAATGRRATAGAHGPGLRRAGQLRLASDGDAGVPAKRGRADAGGAPDRAAVAEALPQAGRALAIVESLMDGGDFLCGKASGLADRHPVPIFGYFARMEDGRAVLARRARAPVGVVGAHGAAPEPGMRARLLFRPRRAAQWTKKSSSHPK